MALDYKTLQAAVRQTTDTLPYCPECGRPWRDPALPHPAPAASHPWRAVPLVVIGLALAVTFGLRAASANQREAAIQGDLAVVTGCLGRASATLTCTPEETEVWLRVDYENLDAVPRQRDRALVVAAFGLLALGVGLAGVARRRRRQHRPRPPLAAVWEMGESLVALACLQVLALTLCSIAVQLARGLPLAWDRLDTAADGVLVLVSLLTGR